MQLQGTRPLPNFQLKCSAGRPRARQTAKTNRLARRKKHEKQRTDRYNANRDHLASGPCITHQRTPGDSRKLSKVEFNVPVAIFEELLTIEWPDEFIVEYADGRKERLLRGEGVSLILPKDDPEGSGGLSADLPKKHPRNQTTCGRHIRFTELRGIYALEGRRLWPTA